MVKAGLKNKTARSEIRGRERHIPTRATTLDYVCEARNLNPLRGTRKRGSGVTHWGYREALSSRNVTGVAFVSRASSFSMTDCLMESNEYLLAHRSSACITAELAPNQSNHINAGAENREPQRRAR